MIHHHLSNLLLTKLDAANQLLTANRQHQGETALNGEYFDGFQQWLAALLKDEQLLFALLEQYQLLPNQTERLKAQWTQLSEQSQWVEQLQQKQIDTGEDQQNLQEMMLQHRDELLSSLIPVLEERLSGLQSAKLTLKLAPGGML